MTKSTTPRHAPLGIHVMTDEDIIRSISAWRRNDSAGLLEAIELLIEIQEVMECRVENRDISNSGVRPLDENPIPKKNRGD